MNLSEFDLQCLLERWAGIRPRTCCMRWIEEHSRRLLADAADIFDRPGKLPDRCGKVAEFLVSACTGSPHARSPRRGNRNQLCRAPSPGEMPDRSHCAGICYLGFIDPTPRSDLLNDLRRRWPQATLREDSETTDPSWHTFSPSGSQPPELDILVGAAASKSGFGAHCCRSHRDGA